MQSSGIKEGIAVISNGEVKARGRSQCNMMEGKISGENNPQGMRGKGLRKLICMDIEIEQFGESDKKPGVNLIRK